MHPARENINNADPLGFTKQTATMLIGLGAEDLIPQFKKRNISSQGLAELNKQDLIVLGADESLADDILRQLRAAARNHGGKTLDDELRTKQLFRILEGAKNHLDFSKTFICYARLRLVEKSEDFIIDFDKNIRASEALVSAASCIIADVENLENNLRDLFSEFTDCKTESKSLRSRSIVLFTGLSIGFLCALRYAIVRAR